MGELSKKLEIKKNARGAISFDTLELDFILENDDVVKGINDENRGLAEKLIENFMLVANQIVSTFAYYLQVDFMAYVYKLTRYVLLFCNLKILLYFL